MPGPTWEGVSDSWKSCVTIGKGLAICPGRILRVPSSGMEKRT